MFSMNKILELLSLYQLSDNCKNFQPEDLHDRKFLKHDLVEVKI